MDRIFPRKNSARSTVSNRRVKSKQVPFHYGTPVIAQKGKTLKKTAPVSKKDPIKHTIHLENRIKILETRVEILENSLKTRTRSMTKRKDTLDSIDRKLMQNSNKHENRHLFPGAIFEAIDSNDTTLLQKILSENSSALNEESNNMHPLEYAVKHGNLPIIKLLVSATPKDRSLDGVINLALKIQEERERTEDEFKYAGIYKYLVLSKKNRNK